MQGFVCLLLGTKCIFMYNSVKFRLNGRNLGTYKKQLPLRKRGGLVGRAASIFFKCQVPADDIKNCAIKSTNNCALLQYGINYISS